MNMSDDLKGKINQLLEAKPRLSFNNDGCDVLDKGGNCVRSFKQKDLGEKYKKSAEVFLAANYSKLNAEGFVWKEEELQELSPKTLISYRDKALKDASGKHQEAQRAYDGGNYNRADSKLNASKKRVASMNTATDKLTKKRDELKADLKKEEKVEEGMADAIKSKLHPSRVERNAASRRQDQEAAAKSAVKKAVASTVAKSLEKKEIKETEQEVQHTEVETPMTNMERLAGFISSQTKVQSADGTSMMGVKKDLEEKKKMSKAEFKDMMAGKGKKDKGDMDGDGKDEPDSKEYMDNKDAAIKKSMGKKGKDVEEAIDQQSSDPAKTIGHNCATHVEHAEFGAGECIPGMHTLEETSEGEGIVTHYDVMFKNEDGHFVKEGVSVEDLTIVKEMHHGHKKKKK